MASAKKNKEINHNNLVAVKPITDNQKVVFDTWKKGKNQFMFGAAGTGKTFISLYLAMQAVMDLKTKYEKVILVRSLIPTREIGFLPGDEEDKAALYQVPYQNMVQFMFEQPNEQSFKNLYDRLKGQGTLYFLSTSFLRGLTVDNAIIILLLLASVRTRVLCFVVTLIKLIYRGLMNEMVYMTCFVFLKRWKSLTALSLLLAILYDQDLCVVI